MQAPVVNAQRRKDRDATVAKSVRNGSTLITAHNRGLARVAAETNRVVKHTALTARTGQRTSVQRALLVPQDPESWPVILVCKRVNNGSASAKLPELHRRCSASTAEEGHRREEHRATRKCSDHERPGDDHGSGTRPKCTVVE